MKKLYDSTGHIKIDAIEKALYEAKRRGELPNVPSHKIKYFIEGLEEEIKEHHGRVGNRISKREVEFLLKELMREKNDHVTDSELRTIESIITDKDFQIR